MAARPVVYKINIGEGVLIVPNVTISTTNHPMHYMARQHEEMYCKKVVIEDHVWIGSNVVICAGVTVGKGSVIGAGSVVTRDIPPMSFAAGVWKTDRNLSGRRPEYLTYVASISNQQDSIEIQYEDENIWLTQKIWLCYMMLGFRQ